MISKQHTQNRILNLVELYKRGFPNEYQMACDGVIMQRQMLADETAVIKGEHSGASAQRALFEMPEKLYQSIYKTLDGDEITYFKSKEGGRWFTKAVPQFALAKL
jgi:hypothetical protein